MKGDDIVNIQKELKKFSKDIQKKAEAIGITYLQQKYTDSITEDDIEKEYQEGIESGEIDYYSENIEKESVEEVSNNDDSEDEETDFSEEDIQEAMQEISEDTIIQLCENKGISNPDEESIQELKRMIAIANLKNKESEEWYSLTEDDIFDLLSKEGFYIDSDNYKLKRSIQKIMFQLWENQHKPLTSESLNDYSIKRQGLPFKKYLFCEEYMKSGNITKTCESLCIGRTTGQRYLNDEEVKAYIQERRQEMKSENEERMKEGFHKCFNKLLEITEESGHQDSDKIKAIDTFLKHYSNMMNPTDKGNFDE